MGTKDEVLSSAKENIGKDANLTLDNGLIVLVRILDAKFSYGHVIYTVTPVAGSGTALVRTNLEIIGA